MNLRSTSLIQERYGQKKFHFRPPRRHGSRAASAHRKKQTPAPMGAHLVLQRAHLVLQRKRGHGGRARPIVSCTCDRERTNSNNESSDNGEYNLNQRSPPFRRGAWSLYNRYALPSL